MKTKNESTASVQRSLTILLFTIFLLAITAMPSIVFAAATGG